MWTRREKRIPVAHLVERDVLGDVLGELVGVTRLARHRHHQPVGE